MVNDLRKLLQSRLSEIEGLASGKAKPDDVIEEDRHVAIYCDISSAKISRKFA